MPGKANHSPRLSFSHDFCDSNSIPIEQNPLRPQSESSSFNFDFCIPGGESSWSAEEFFSDGRILPTEIKKRPEPETNPIWNVKPVEAKPNPKSAFDSSEPDRPKPEKNSSRNVKPVHEIEEEEDEVMVMEEKPNTMPFWGFKKRSNSLNPEIGLPLLRNNSTGSNSKKTETMKLEVSSSSSSTKCSFQKLPLMKKKKNYRGYSYSGNGGGIKVSSILDLFPSGSLFGLGSITVGSGSDNDKNKKRTMIFWW